MEIDSAVIDPLWQNAVEEINHLHGEIIESIRTSIPKAIRIGELLTGIKLAPKNNRPVKHGEWQRWIENTFPFSDQTARRYMRYWESREILKTSMNGRFELTMNEADSIIASNSNGNIPGGSQHLHEPNFYSRAIGFRDKLIASFNHYLQRRPLRQWYTQEVYDLWRSMNSLSEVRHQLEVELETRDDVPASYRS